MNVTGNRLVVRNPSEIGPKFCRGIGPGFEPLRWRRLSISWSSGPFWWLRWCWMRRRARFGFGGLPVKFTNPSYICHIGAADQGHFSRRAGFPRGTMTEEDGPRVRRIGAEHLPRRWCDRNWNSRITAAKLRNCDTLGCAEELKSRGFIVLLYCLSPRQECRGRPGSSIAQNWDSLLGQRDGLSKEMFFRPDGTCTNSARPVETCDPRHRSRHRQPGAAIIPQEQRVWREARHRVQETHPRHHYIR